MNGLISMGLMISSRSHYSRLLTLKATLMKMRLIRLCIMDVVGNILRGAPLDTQGDMDVWVGLVFFFYTAGFFYFY